MTYEIRFKEVKIDKEGKEHKFLYGTSVIKTTSRVNIQSTIDNLDEIRTKRWNYTLKGCTIKCNDVQIFEPTYKTVMVGDKKRRRKTGMSEISIPEFKWTYCRICGRTLVNPISVARGVGPECIKKGGSNRFTNDYLDDKISKFTSQLKEICRDLDQVKTLKEINESIKKCVSLGNTSFNKPNLVQIGYYLLRRFVN